MKPLKSSWRARFGFEPRQANSLLNCANHGVYLRLSYYQIRRARVVRYNTLFIAVHRLFFPTGAHVTHCNDEIVAYDFN